MGLIKNRRKNTLAGRMVEEALYQEASEELASEMVRPGLMAKALSMSDGDEVKAKGVYLKLRVQSLMDEAEIAQLQVAEAEKYETANREKAAIEFVQEQAKSRRKINDPEMLKFYRIVLISLALIGLLFYFILAGK